MIKDIADKPVDISAVIDLAIAYNPVLAMRDISTVRMWLNEGCDVKLDIIPEMARIMKYKKGITAFKYFTNPILESRDKRLVKEKQIKDAIKAPEQHYIQIYLWKRKKGLALSVEQERELDDWIQKNPNRLD